MIKEIQEIECNELTKHEDCKKLNIGEKNILSEIKPYILK